MEFTSVPQVCFTAKSVSSTAGRRHNMDSDLRDRLGRQFSPERRPSLDRSGRRVQRFSGHDNPRPFENRRDNEYRENRRFDERRNYAGGLKAGNRIEDRAEDGRNKFQGYNNVLEEQLKDVEMDVKMLTDDKQRLEASVERKAHEVDILSSRIHELETQLDREKEECRRITSNTKKFVKEYNRFLRAQDDLKRSEARLQKLGNQLSTYLAGSEGNNRDAGVDIVSDEENNGRNLRAACDPQNELQNTSSLSRKKHYVDQYTTKEPVEDGLIGRGEEEKVEKEKKRPCWNMVSSKSYSEEESGAWNDEDTINKSSSKEDNWKRRRISIGTSSTDKVISSTSMAAREFDDDAESEEENPEAAKGSPLISLPPPPPFRDAHVQGDEDDVSVDVMEQKKANDDDSV
ncbi:zinc finger CCCH domain-containing protein 40 isoform X2 [Arabidopsis lyrata subsp. lyrata]|uniref:zinc finger CCCH domain-containing protein 40 isoform X2 n=1 Tax=Arabidopsis lyrata subsp. lyrata TaxID=81972 RepID=UPI000A29CBD3|nr:zinc finger CCCH domain-containing protein 40 isoform X2 [Arabidopsis lyrata subsp. lyrata]|eukprot:XP_020887138.1 zinc finger CCCH domain-containing protein 40 isoform X2 [Arabidopsis lyrata subsp. lyrata]